MSVFTHIHLQFSYAQWISKLKPCSDPKPQRSWFYAFHLVAIYESQLLIAIPSKYLHYVSSQMPLVNFSGTKKDDQLIKTCKGRALKIFENPLYFFLFQQMFLFFMK